MPDTDDRTIYRRLADVKRECPAIPKADRNTEQKFDFRGIERIMAVLSPLFAKHGVIVMPRVQGIRRWITERGDQRKPWEHYRIEVVYRFYGELGDHVDARVYGEGLDNADKGISKAMTMAEKVAMLQVLSIADPSDDDPDARGPVDDPSPRRRPARARPDRGQNAPTPPEPPTHPPNPPTWMDRLEAKHGPAHREAVVALSDEIGTIQDSEIRTKVIDQFIALFGQPEDVAPDDLAAASEWVRAVMDVPDAPDAAPAPETQPANAQVPVADDQPPTPGTCRVCGAAATDSTDLYCGDHEPFD